MKIVFRQKGQEMKVVVNFVCYQGRFWKVNPQSDKKFLRLRKVMAMRGQNEDILQVIVQEGAHAVREESPGVWFVSLDPELLAEQDLRVSAGDKVLVISKTVSAGNPNLGEMPKVGESFKSF